MIEHKCSTCGQVCQGELQQSNVVTGTVIMDDLAWTKGAGTKLARVQLSARKYKGPGWDGEVLWGPLITTVNCGGGD